MLSRIICDTVSVFATKPQSSLFCPYLYNDFLFVVETLSVVQEAKLNLAYFHFGSVQNQIGIVSITTT